MKKMILIADDDNEMCEELAATLRASGYSVKTAGDGRAALKLVKKHKFDLLLLDIKMPVMTGFDVLKQLELDKTKLAIIVLTGSILGSALPGEKDISAEEKIKILKTADLVMNKPFDIVRLMDNIRKFSA